MEHKIRRPNRVLSPISISYSRPTPPYGRTIGISIILVFIFLAILLFSFWSA